MRLTFEARQDIRRLVAVFGISLAFIVVQTAPALAAGKDSDRDQLSNRIERDVTETNPFDADSDNDLIKDGDEDEDGVDNTNELSLETDLDDDDCDELEDEDDDDEED